MVSLRERMRGIKNKVHQDLDNEPAEEVIETSTTEPNQAPDSTINSNQETDSNSSSKNAKPKQDDKKNNSSVTALGRSSKRNKERKEKEIQEEKDKYESGELKEVHHSRCRMWSEHDRILEWLDQEDCADLLVDFKDSTIGQKIPCIARPLPDSEKEDFEIVAGARRYWTKRHLDLKVLLFVKEMNDDQAYIEMNRENNDRKDPSPYEKGRNFHKKLNKLYKTINKSECKNSKEIEAKEREIKIHLAKLNKISEGNLNKYLQLYNLPTEILASLTPKGKREMTQSFGVTVKSLLKNNSKISDKVLKELANDNEEKPLDNPNDFLSAMRKKIQKLKVTKNKVAQKEKEYFDKNGKLMLTAQRTPTNIITFKVAKNTQATRKELEESISEFFDYLEF
jgi:ParB/RepB/Spo0J family partition protein